MFLMLLEMYISQLKLLCMFSKKKCGTEFKNRDCNLTNKYDSVSVFLAISLFETNDIYAVTLLELLPEADHQNDLLAEMGKSAVGWKRPKRTPVNNLDLKREKRPCTTEYMPPFGFEKGTS